MEEGEVKAWVHTLCVAMMGGAEGVLLVFFLDESTRHDNVSTQ